MSLSPQDLAKVARLARLQLTEEEQQKFAQELNAILDYVDVLSEVDTSNVEPMAHIADLTNVLRPDVLTPGLTREEALKNAPQSNGKYFLVPPILEGA